MTQPSSDKLVCRMPNCDDAMVCMGLCQRHWEWLNGYHAPEPEEAARPLADDRFTGAAMSARFRSGEEGTEVDFWENLAAEIHAFRAPLADGLTDAISDAVSGILDVLIDRELIEPSPPHANALLGEQIFEAIATTASLTALLQHKEEAERERDEVAWLIERPGSHPYWSLEEAEHPPRHWTADHNLAVRFARKADAVAVIARINVTDAIAVEHTWVKP